jgi:hypothetical protein
VTFVREWIKWARGAPALLLIAGVPEYRAAAPEPQIAIDAASWHLESSSGGISIYTSTVPGTGIVPCKATMTIPGTIEEVSLVLEDIPRRREWVSNFSRSVLLDRPNDYDQTEYRTSTCRARL